MFKHKNSKHFHREKFSKIRPRQRQTRGTLHKEAFCGTIKKEFVQILSAEEKGYERNNHILFKTR